MNNIGVLKKCQPTLMPVSRYPLCMLWELLTHITYQIQLFVITARITVYQPHAKHKSSGFFLHVHFTEWNFSWKADRYRWSRNVLEKFILALFPFIFFYYETLNRSKNAPQFKLSQPYSSCGSDLFTSTWKPKIQTWIMWWKLFPPFPDT